MTSSICLRMRSMVIGLTMLLSRNLDDVNAALATYHHRR